MEINKRFIFGGAIGLVVTAGIIAGAFILNKDNTPNLNDSDNNVVVEQQDKNESNKEPELNREDSAKVESFNLYDKLKTDGKLVSPESYLDYIKKIVANEGTGIYSYTSTGDNLSEIYKDTISDKVVLEIYFNKDMASERFKVYKDGVNVELFINEDGYIHKMYENGETSRVLTREYEGEILLTELEIVKLEHGVMVDKQYEFSKDEKTCKQTLELKLTLNSDFKSTDDLFKSMLKEEDIKFFIDINSIENSEDTAE